MNMFLSYVKYFICLIIVFTDLFVQSDVDYILVNPKISDTMNISQLGSLVQVIHLESTTSSMYLGPTQLILDEEYIFLTLGTYPLSVAQFKRDGKFIRNISMYKDDEIQFDYPVNFTCDVENNILLIKCRRTVFFFDYDGNFIKKMKMPLPGEIFCYKNKIWGFDLQWTDIGKDLYHLTSWDQYGDSIRRGTLIHYKDGVCEKFEWKSIKDAMFTSNDEVMYFSNEADPIIYKFSDNEIIPVCEFSFPDEYSDCLDITAERVEIIGENWYVISYHHNMRRYSLLYKNKTKKSYNLPGEIINDDLFGTQGIKARNLKTMRGGYFGYIISSAEIKSDKIEIPDNAGLCLIVMKAK